MNGGRFIPGNLVSPSYLWGGNSAQRGHFCLGKFCPPGTVWPSQYCLGGGALFQAILARGAISAGGQSVLLHRDFKLLSKWDNGLESCRLPGCNFLVGDVEHLLSGDCPALRDALATTLSSSIKILQDESPLLVPPIFSALNRGSFGWTQFVLDPSVDVNVIKIKQMFGSQYVWPLFRMSRAYVRCMHREKSRKQKTDQ